TGAISNNTGWTMCWWHKPGDPGQSLPKYKPATVDTEQRLGHRRAQIVGEFGFGLVLGVGVV
ncbi:MAG: hypothetical protein ACE5GO_02605, partial [Anaerolineales bacterium]